MVLRDKVEAIGKLHILWKHGDPQQGFCWLLANRLKNAVDFLLTSKTRETKPYFPYISDLNKQTYNMNKNWCNNLPPFQAHGRPALLSPGVRVG